MKHIGNIKPAEGSKHKKKRIGRGPGSGHGGTATRGHKGQKSRSGATVGRGFEGGQMPLNRRVPKFGFKNVNRIEYQVVNLSTLQELFENNKIENNSVNFDTLISLGVIHKKRQKLKILGNGELKAALNITAHHFSETAKSKIESAGGTVVVNG